MLITGPDAERIIALREQAAAELAAAAAERERAAALAAEAELIRDAALHSAGLASDAERRLAGLDRDAGRHLAADRIVNGSLRAGRPDRDPVRPSPGPGTWASPMPVAAPAADPAPATAKARDGTSRDPFAGLPGMRPRAALSAEDRVRWRPVQGRPW